VESISLNIEAVNTHRERPEVSVAFPQSCPLVSPSFPLRSTSSEDGWVGHEEIALLGAQSAAGGLEHQMGSCSAKTWPVEGFLREEDCYMSLLPTVFAQIKAGPGNGPPWSLTFTAAVRHSPEQGMEPQMEKVTSPRSPSWLAEPGLNTLSNISCLCGFFIGVPVAPWGYQSAVL